MCIQFSCLVLFPGAPATCSSFALNPFARLRHNQPHHLLFSMNFTWASRAPLVHLNRVNETKLHVNLTRDLTSAFHAMDMKSCCGANCTLPAWLPAPCMPCWTADDFYAAAAAPGITSQLTSRPGGIVPVASGTCTKCSQSYAAGATPGSVT